MSLLTLTEVLGEPRRWSGKNGGEFDSWKVRADDGTTYEINTKAGNAVKLGQDEFEVVPPKEGTSFPPKLRRQSQQGGGGRGRSPQETAAIQRQHSQEMALRALDWLQRDDTPIADFPAEIKKWTDWFDADIRNGASVAPSAPQTASQGSPSPAPTQSKGFASEPQKAHFRRLLKQAGGSDETVGSICWYASEQMPTAEISTAMDGLTDESTRQATAKSLAVASNEWHLRTGSTQPDDSDLPQVAA